ncbi:MAG TPA: DNA repair exonuclease [Planctomicrobium sp.]|nr:DNA repair exonuclease [Planctomicrobium sp.]
MKFIHTADIHLDSPLRGLESYPDAPVEALRLATRKAFDRVIDLCLSEEVDFLLIAGDLFDTDVKDFNAALAAASQLRRLDQANIPVYLILGNHDSRQEMTRHVPWPANVTLFNHKKPETIRHPTLPVAIHGMSYPQREVNENLVPDYPDPVAGCFNIGLLHTNAVGTKQHASYAPCTVQELIAKGYDYWGLGHVHDFKVLHPHPAVVYSGNTQGRNIRETDRKGCVLVTVNDVGEPAGIEFRETDLARWFYETIELSPEDDVDGLVEAVRNRLRDVMKAAQGRTAAVRLELTGRCLAHASLTGDFEKQQLTTTLRGLASDLGEGLWIEKIRFQTQSPLDLDGLRERQDLLGELLREIESIASDPVPLQMFPEAQDLMTKLAADLPPQPEGEDAFNLNDPERQQRWLRDAEAILLSHLVQESDAQQLGVLQRGTQHQEVQP